MSGSTGSPIPYRPEIDGMRAIAVLAVMLYHAGVLLDAGYLGVDVFFVISGYLITSILYQEWNSTGRMDLVAFYARRVRRILPALIVLVVCTVTASLVILPFSQMMEVIQSAAASLAFIGNLYFQATENDYFAKDAGHLPTLHLWSLGVEEQFYAIWPIIFLTILRVRPQFRVVATIALALLSYATAVGLAIVNTEAAFYQMPARFWELAIGAIIALLPARQSGDKRGAAAMGLLLISVATTTRFAVLPPSGVLSAVVGAGLLIYAIHSSNHLGWIGVWLRSSPLVFIGSLSYSFYLWHWPMLAFYRATHIGPPQPHEALLVVATSFVVSWLSYRFVETPWRRRDPKASDLALVASGIAASASLVGLMMQIAAYYQGDALPDDLASRTGRDMPKNRIACHQRGDEAVESVLERNTCTSVTGKPIRVAMWGDSHALAWQPLAWAIAERDGVAATSFTRDACAPILDYNNGKRPQEARLCRDFNALVITKVVGLDTLILTALWPGGQIGKDSERKLDATIEYLAPRVRKILVLGPTPYMKDSAPRCIELGALDACAVDRRVFEVQSYQWRDFLAGLAQKYRNVEYIELTNFFCGDEVCPVVKDGYGLYWDTNHVSSTAARKFSAIFVGSEKQRASEIVD